MRDGGEMDGTSDVSDTDCKFLQNCCQKLWTEETVFKPKV
jgi:hypothetical protein